MNRWNKPQTGFTLVEMLFTLAIGTFVVAGIMTSYIFCVKGFRALSNYNEMQADGRRALDWFSRDLRAGIAVTSCTSNQLVVSLPAAVNSQGQVTVTNQVTHAWQGGRWYRTVSTNGQSTLLAENVLQITFSLYDAAGNVTTQINQAVSVQVDAVLMKTVLSKQQSADLLSARLRLRNTP
jgi:prepilin-type N-terminal cleavage/methylation domain-containing protein